MQLLSFENNASELSFIDDKFPFSFSVNFSCLNSNCNLFILKKNNTIIPYIVSKNYFFKTLQFQFKPLNIDASELNKNEELLFLNEVCDYILNNKIAHRILQPANFALFSSHPHSSIYCKFGTYQISLSNNSNEQLLANMQPRYRTSIRAAQKLNPNIQTGINELEPFYNLHKETLMRTNMHYETFDDLKKVTVTMPNHYFIATIYLNNKIQGGVFFTYTKYGAFYLHGASANNNDADGVVKYLHYWCMCYFKSLHIERYDFVGARLSTIEGTKLEGIQNFKRRFGSQLLKGYLWKKDISPFICWAYDSLLFLKLKLKQHSKPKDIIEQELEK